MQPYVNRSTIKPYVSCFEVEFFPLSRELLLREQFAGNLSASSFYGLCKLIYQRFSSFFQHVLTYQLLYKLKRCQIEIINAFSFVFFKVKPFRELQ